MGLEVQQTAYADWYPVVTPVNGPFRLVNVTVITGNEDSLGQWTIKWKDNNRIQEGSIHTRSLLILIYLMCGYIYEFVAIKQNPSRQRVDFTRSLQYYHACEQPNETSNQEKPRSDTFIGPLLWLVMSAIVLCYIIIVMLVRVICYRHKKREQSVISSHCLEEAIPLDTVGSLVSQSTNETIYDVPRMPPPPTFISIIVPSSSVVQGTSKLHRHSTPNNKIRLPKIQEESK